MARAQATESTGNSPPRPPGLGSQTRPPLTRSLAVRPRDMLALRGLDTRPLPRVLSNCLVCNCFRQHSTTPSGVQAVRACSVT